MLSRDDHDGLVARLYSSAAGEAPWGETLGAVANCFASSAAVFHTRDATSGVVLASVVHGYSREFTERFYASGAYYRDPRVAYFNKVPCGSVYYDRQLYDVEEMARDRHVRESIDALGVQYQLGAMMALPGHAVAGLALLSTPAEGHASPAAIGAFRRLVPHLEQACQLGHIVEGEAVTRAALLEALAHKVDGVVLLDAKAAPVFVNDAAARILAAADGLCLHDGAFVTRRACETRTLHALIGDAIALSLAQGERPGGIMAVTRGAAKQPYAVRALPAPRLERFLTSHRIACVLHIHDLASPPLPAHRALSAVFGLTDREADLAVELVRCAGLDAAAQGARMALNTARNHLHSIFKKTQTASQVELVQLCGRLP